MKLTITPAAVKWFKKELTIDEGMGVRFFGKVYGKTQVHEGFSIGMNVEKPDQPIVSVTEDGILFFADEADEWFFKGYDLTVDYDGKLDEPQYQFTENAEV